MLIRVLHGPGQNTLFLSQQTLQDLDLKSSEIILHFGAREKQVNVMLNAELDQGTVGLSGDLSRALAIPDNLPYDIYFQGEDLYLGPVIGVVVKKGAVSSRRRGFWTDYCQNYADIRGLIYFCMVDGIDMNTQTISGYYFNPCGEGAEQWKSAILPYPGVVYQRTGIPNSILHDLIRHTGGKVFNCYLFNKWEMWQAMSGAGFKNTPHTIMLNGVQSLEQMISNYDSVYLKPLKGRFGRGIVKIQKVSDGYLVKGESGDEGLAKDLHQVYTLVQKYMKQRKYLVQQGVPVIFKDKPVDVRVIMQKDENLEWKCSGIFAKLGYQGRICTNTPSAVYPVQEAFNSIFGLTPEQAVEKEKETIEICTEACKIMEHTYGIYADVGIDAIVDNELKVWILEINKIHQHTMGKYLQHSDPDMYHRVVTTPLVYARALAGFR